MSSSHDLRSSAQPAGPGEKNALNPGLVLNSKWEILNYIASGGKGEVYMAHQKNLERDVAVKIISPEFTDSLKDNAEELSAELERFRREVQVMASIRHPNVLQVFDYDTAVIDGNTVEYLVMEYIAGQTLKQTMPADGFGSDRKGLEEWLRRYFMPVLAGVQAVHLAGVVHRDIKPANVLLDGDTPKLADFGLARGTWASELTRSHHILGTIFYMPPEQFEEASIVDARADTYALGKILFEAVEGKKKNNSRTAMKEVHLDNVEDPFYQVLDSIIREATREDVQERLSSVTALKDRLELLVPRQKAKVAGNSRKSTVRLAVIMGIVLLVAAVSYFAGLSNYSTNSEIHPAGEAPLADGSLPVPRRESIMGKDGSTLQHIAGGEEQGVNPDGTLTGDVFVKDFYMDSTKVTNAAYVAFLNTVSADITTDDSVVAGKDGVWLFLGEATDGYAPIRYQDGKFMVADPSFSDMPVIRVSAIGAMAYASHYGRQLPSVEQWRLAVKRGSSPPLPASMLAGRPYPVSAHTVDLSGIKGLRENIGEWVQGPEGTKKTVYIIGLPPEDTTIPLCPLARKSWEAFSTVGFRTVQPVPEKGTGL